MSHSICGLDCTVCDSKGSCGGCVKTNGRPFQGECVIASCCQKKGFADCSHCAETDCGLKDQLMLSLCTEGFFYQSRLPTFQWTDHPTA